MALYHASGSDYSARTGGILLQRVEREGFTSDAQQGPHPRHSQEEKTEISWTTVRVPCKDPSPTGVPWLYRMVHQAHHQNRITFALTAQDASPAELLSLQVLALTSAWVVGCHPLSEALFHLLNTWLAVEDHCGYDLPWALHRLLPCFGGAPFHQAHHHVYRGNYAPYFRHWDWLCGTYLRVREEAGRKHGGRTMRRRRRRKSLGSDCVCARACVC
ncbi:cholesterol 25-hydroxylase-like protein isoform X2 [Salvelinus alpinus]|uniref:cholesterol 25-hydroxylase-like protein isoform X2 n=1 Tax=Salvelinus alpinus TaxID=8036 RepID=UPI0039FD2222